MYNISKNAQVEKTKDKQDLAKQPEEINKSGNRRILKHAEKSLEYGGNPLLVKPNKKSKKRLRWADGKTVDCKLITASEELCKVKYIPLEIRQRAGPELGNQVDKGTMMRNHNNPANHIQCMPERAIESPLPNHGSVYNFNKKGHALIPHNYNINSAFPYDASNGIIMDTSRVCTRKDILNKILRWMPQWLEEQKLQRDEPEVIKSWYN